MRPSQINDDHDLAAGAFAAWVVGMQGAIRGDHGSDVPCGECTACCTSSQFVHIEPDETETLAHIPAELLFPAPFRPRGHVVLGYDEHGHCPMLVDSKCSIYDHRPRTCRTYDCRVFPAAGVEVEGADKVGIALQARRWRFSYPSDADRSAQDGVCAAVRLLQAERAGGAPTNATQLAIRAIETYDDARVSRERGRDGDADR